MSTPSVLLLPKLNGVKPRSTGSWIARCPAHEDKSPSLAIRECSDGTILLKCFAGCGAADIVAAVGLELSDLFPAREIDYAKPHKPIRRPPLSAKDVIAAIRRDLVCFVLACEQVAHGEPLSDEDRETLLESYRELIAFLSEVENVW